MRSDTRCRARQSFRGLQSAPFIGRNWPFVGPCLPPIRPFICRNQPFKSTTRYFGFTMIELLITLVIAGLLLGLAVPGFRSFLKDQEMTGLTNALVTDLTFTRSEAIKRGKSLGLCQSASGNACDGDSWTAGRAIYIDTNSDSVRDNNEAIIRVAQPIVSDKSLTISDGSLTQILFDASGKLTTASAVVFRLCDDRGKSNGRQVTVTSTGQVRAGQLASTCE